MRTDKLLASAGLGLIAGLALATSYPAAADQVIADDLIVQGSTCVGLDCVNNENFGFDTLKLKENNLRIFFEDTSSIPGFPSNDWRLIANDSASGGSNFFAIQDATLNRNPFTVAAGAEANAIFVDASSRVGFRTATPALDLHVNAIDTPALRLQQNVGGGFTAQTWDIGGNDANFFVRDLTGGSRLPFRVRPGAPTSSLDIAASGNIGVGTNRPTQRLDVRSAMRVANTDFVPTSTGTFMDLSLSAAAGATEGRLQVFNNGGNTDGPLLLNPLSGNVGVGTATPGARLHTVGTVRFAGVAGCTSGIQSNGNGDLSCLASSRQFKNVTGDLPPNVALANVMALRPQTGSFKATPDVPEHWLIAEEVAAVDPALIGLSDGRPYVVKTQNVVADLVAVVQQQQRQIEELKRLIAAK